MSSLSVKFQVHKVDIDTLKRFKEAQIPIPGSKERISDEQLFEGVWDRPLECLAQ